MKTINLIFALNLLALTLYGQVKLKKVTTAHKNPRYTETYYVLKNNPQIKQGEYQKLRFRGQLEIQGYYNNNNRDSIWSFYDYKERLRYKFNYDSNTLVEYHWYDTPDTLLVKKEGVWIYDTVDSPPLSLDAADVNDFIYTRILYPPDAAEKYISGKVIISVIIDATGVVKEYAIYKSVYKSLDEESLRVVKLISNWYPAIKNNKKVECKLLIPINFTMYKQ